MKEKELTSYESLVTRIRAGNRAAAAELVDLYYMQIYLYMRRLGYSIVVSEDLTQETFLQIWQHVGQLRSSRALNSWIYKVASNVSRLYLRKHKGKNPASIEEIVLPSDANDEENMAELNEQLNQLKKAVFEMPLKFKEVIVLHYLQGLNIR
ncbi:MAG: RNA polymerase sigma factor, partial [Planctomycetota bacterium]